MVSINRHFRFGVHSLGGKGVTGTLGIVCGAWVIARSRLASRCHEKKTLPPVSPKGACDGQPGKLKYRVLGPSRIDTKAFFFLGGGGDIINRRLLAYLASGGTPFSEQSFCRAIALHTFYGIFVTINKVFSGLEVLKVPSRLYCVTFYLFRLEMHARPCVCYHAMSRLEHCVLYPRVRHLSNVNTRKSFGPVFFVAGKSHTLHYFSASPALS